MNKKNSVVVQDCNKRNCVVKQGNVTVSKTKRRRHKNYDTLVKSVVVTYYSPRNKGR